MSAITWDTLGKHEAKMRSIRFRIAIPSLPQLPYGWLQEPAANLNVPATMLSVCLCLRNRNNTMSDACANTASS